MELEDLTGTTLPATNPSSIFCSLLSYIFAFFFKKKERLKQLLGDACDRCCVLLSGEQCLELGKLSLRKISAAVSKRVPPKSWSLGHAQTMHVIVGAGYSFKDLNFGSLLQITEFYLALNRELKAGLHRDNAAEREQRNYTRTTTRSIDYT